VREAGGVPLLLSFFAVNISQLKHGREVKMCLRNVVKRFKEPVEQEVVVYKLMDRTWNNVLSTPYRDTTLPNGKWLQASTGKGLRSSNGQLYKVGFHCFMKKEDAFGRGNNTSLGNVIVKCLARGCTSVGTENALPEREVGVFNELKIVRVIGTRSESTGKFVPMRGYGNKQIGG
jgi:hypothetical protein